MEFGMTDSLLEGVWRGSGEGARAWVKEHLTHFSMAFVLNASTYAR